MSETTDVPDELVARAMAGDRVAVGNVIAIIRPLVVRYCRARLGRERSFATADDVAQEVCLAVLTALPGYRVQGRPFLAFVYGIASHKVIDAHRAATRNKSESVAVGATAVEAEDVMEGDVLVATPNWLTTRAISIRATPSKVWPWLAQMGELLDVHPHNQGV